MRLRHYLFLLLVVLFCFISSCVVEDENVLEIPFTKVVGTYAGESRICKPTTMSQDTTCGQGFSNSLKVILFSNNAIIIEDQSDIFGKVRLKYIKTDLVNGNKHISFESAESGMDFKLLFNETTSEINVAHTFPNGSNIIIDYFVGKK